MNAPFTRPRTILCAIGFLVTCPAGVAAEPRAFTLRTEQITSGSKHHFFGYIGQCRTVPWNASGRYIVGLEINHTLWNRRSDRVYFFVRAGWSGRGGTRINTPFSVHSDGSGLTLHQVHIGGHPEWAEGSLLIGRQGDRQILYDVDEKKIVGQLGDPEIFPKPEGDIALSPDGRWFVNGFKQGAANYYSVLRRHDGAAARSEGIDKGGYDGDIRIDPAPRWNRTSDAILVPGIAKNGTRQMFVIRVQD